MLGFEMRGKPDYPEKSLLEQRREPTANSTHIIMVSMPGFEPRPCWLGASALTTAPSLAPHILRQKSLILSTVELPISDHPKCEDLVVGYRRWSLKRIKLQKCQKRLRRHYIILLYYMYFQLVSYNICSSMFFQFLSYNNISVVPCCQLKLFAHF